MKLFGTPRASFAPSVCQRLAKAVWSELVLTGMPAEDYDIVRDTKEVTVVNKFTGEVAASFRITPSLAEHNL